MMKTPPNQPPRQEPQPVDLPADDLSPLRDEWEAEADRSIDESALRRRPDWIESIGDEDETQGRIERNIRDEWERRGEDDFVSDPTAPSDMPGWVGDDYDDEYPGDVDELDDRVDER